MTDKRFTDAELAAEVHKMTLNIYQNRAFHEDGTKIVPRILVLQRFATTPHYDEERSSE